VEDGWPKGEKKKKKIKGGKGGLEEGMGATWQPAEILKPDGLKSAKP